MGEIGFNGPRFDARSLTPRYHVPRSQVWERSRGNQVGKVHLHVTADVTLGRLKRTTGRALCGRDGWYDRPANGEELCPRCVEIAERHGLEVPA